MKQESPIRSGFFYAMTLRSLNLFSVYDDRFDEV